MFYPKFFLNGNYVVISWFTAIKTFFFYLLDFFSFSFFAIVSPFLSIDDLFFLKIFLNKLGTSNYFYEEVFFGLNFDFRFFFLINTSVVLLEDLFFCFFLFLDLRKDSPLLYVRIRKSFLKNYNNFFACSFGSFVDSLSFPVLNCGNTVKSFLSLVEGKYFLVNNFFVKSFFFFKLLNYDFFCYKKFDFFLGYNLFYYSNNFFFFDSIFFFFSKIRKDYIFYTFTNFHFICDYMGKINLLEIGLVNQTWESLLFKSNFFNNSFLWLLNTNIFNFNFESSFIIYQGSFEFNSFQIFMFLPTSIFVEKVSFFYNLEGRIRKSLLAIDSFFLVFSDSAVFLCLIFFLKKFYLVFFSSISNFYEFFFFLKNIIDYSCLFFFKKIAINFFNYFFFMFPLLLLKYKIFNNIFVFKRDLNKNVFINNSKINLLSFNSDLKNVYFF